MSQPARRPKLLIAPSVSVSHPSSPPPPPPNLAIPRNPLANPSYSPDCTHQCCPPSGLSAQPPWIAHTCVVHGVAEARSPSGLHTPVFHRVVDPCAVLRATPAFAAPRTRGVVRLNPRRLTRYRNQLGGFHTPVFHRVVDPNHAVLR